MRSHMADGNELCGLSVSMRAEYVRALDLLAREDGDGKRSQTIRRLIEREMRDRFGENWRAVVTCQQRAA